MKSSSVAYSGLTQQQIFLEEFLSKPTVEFDDSFVPPKKRSAGKYSDAKTS